MRSRLLLALSLVVIFSGATSTAHATRFQADNQWVHIWEHRDQDIRLSITAAARVFSVSESLMTSIVGGEGGSISPAKLRVTLCQPYAYGYAGGGGLGWNNGGSYAFGPFQFMLDAKPACTRGSLWGTFGSYDDAAFQDAKRRGWPIPYRFKTPASNVGQAVTAAYMLANGGLHHWCASMC